MLMLKWMKRGFTLVEVAIVLVIVGFIVGGILAAQSMVESTKVQRVVRDIQTFNSAFNLFKEAYGSLPGDMANTYEVFGWQAACGVDGRPDLTNGDGNGVIDLNNAELIRSWCQLRNLGYLDSKIYVLGSTNFAGSPWTFPKGPFEKTYYTNPQSTNRCHANFTNCIILTSSIHNVDERDASVTPTIGLAIDSKMDDGVPNTGDVVGVHSWVATEQCMAYNAQEGDHYNKSINSIACYMGFRLRENGSY